MFFTSNYLIFSDLWLVFYFHLWAWPMALQLLSFCLLVFVTVVLQKSVHPLLLAQFPVYGQSLICGQPGTSFTGLLECNREAQPQVLWISEVKKTSQLLYFTEGYYKAALH